MTPTGLDSATWALIMRGLVLGRYSLLLGAGASIGSRNAANEPLPAGKELGNQLSTEYGIPVSADAGLRTIYDLARRLAHRDGRLSPGEFLRPKFQGCSVPGWYENMVRVPWRIVWNLNIDDVVENAYRIQFKGVARQRMQSLSWKDRQSFHREPSDVVSVVHLHGRADSGDLVFGSLEYLAAVAEGGASHRLFWDSWQSDPVIIVGATLSDEIDMAAPLSMERLPEREGMKSLIVCPDFSEFDRFRLESIGLLPVPMTGETFFSAVRDSWLDAVRDIDEVMQAAADGVNPHRAYFSRHFRPPSTRADRLHDFYAGHEPVYGDILHNLDARRVIDHLPAASDLQTLMPADQLTVLAFTGLLSGASTSELRFLSDCQDAGLHPYEHDGEAAFDPAALVWMARRDPQLIIRVPELSDFGDALSRLREMCISAKVTLRLVTTSRPERISFIEEAAEDSFRRVSVPSRLRDREIRAVIDALDRNNRLNIIGPLTPVGRFKFFRDAHKRDLVDGIAAATLGSGFVERIAAEYAKTAGTGDAEIAELIVLAADTGYALPEGVVARTLRRHAADIAKVIAGDVLGSFVVMDGGFVRARHPSLAARIGREYLTRERRYDLSLRLAEALAPYVSPATISARTRATRIVAQLMDGQRVFGWFGRTLTDEWYEGLGNSYGWNSRYWEQRALAECEDSEPRYDRAESWAREAVTKHQDPYSLNTLGTVQLRRSLSGGAFDEEKFFAGLANVDEARRSLKRPSEHPYVTALSYIRRAYRLTEGQDDLRRRISRLFDDWVEEARNSASWRSRRGQRAIREQMQALSR